ncbi:MAG: DNA/RNA non-specific endonuclease [Crocinitomicaceae bacterium]|nr:DNA/RNA non-specific endonuclease [Crocinitomicaceae bacterium]
MLKISRYILLFLLCIYIDSISAQEQLLDKVILNNREKYFNACNEDEAVVHHSCFSLMYNDSLEQAEWVSYKLTLDQVESGVNRTNDFREDTMILSGSATLRDYAKSGYDRGHLAPAGSMKNSKRSMSESFLLSNISPQIPAFNRGVWKRLEEKVRFWVERYDSLFVITGPILDDPIAVIGPNKVAVPSAFFKTIIAYKDDQVTGIAFLIPHSASSESLYSFATSIDQIEEIKGMDFYCKLNAENMKELEANESIKAFLFGI